MKIKSKRILSVLVTAVMMISMITPAFASSRDTTLHFDLTCKDKHSITVPTGTIVDIVYRLYNNDTVDPYDISSIQNEIYWDTEFFELVDIETVLSNTGEDHIYSTGEHRIYFANLLAQTYQPTQVIGIARLKVVETQIGAFSTLVSKQNKAYGTDYEPFGVTSADCTVIVGDEEPGTYGITYRSDGEIIKQSEVPKNSDIVLAGAPVKDGYVFKGWKSSETDYPSGSDYKVTDDVVFDAVWEKSDGGDVLDKEYTLSFETNNGTQIDSVTAKAGTEFTLSDYKTSRSGYTFGGWYADSALKTPVSIVKLISDTTVYAKWNSTGGGGGGGGGGGVQTINYTLTFETNGGNEISSVTKASGTTIDLSEYKPQKGGAKFTGWYEDAACTTPVESVELTKNITVYAGWKPIGGSRPTILTDVHDAYIVGREDGFVHPEDNITRVEVATIFFRLLTDETRNSNYSKNNSFDDVAAGDWFNTAVSTLQGLEILKGRTDESFVPNDFITRAEFATIAARFNSSEYSGEDKFTDIEGHWAREYINRAADFGWIVGYEGLFRPDDNITRAEAMTLVNRVLERQPETTGDLLPDMVQFPDNADVNAWYYLAICEATNSHDYEMKDDKIHEKWTALRENRDWAELER